VNISTKLVDVGIYTAQGSEVTLSKQSMPSFILTQVTGRTGLTEAGPPDKAQRAVFPKIILYFCSTIQAIILGSPTVLTPLLKYHPCDPQPVRETRDPRLQRSVLLHLHIQYPRKQRQPSSIKAWNPSPLTSEKKIK